MGSNSLWGYVDSNGGGSMILGDGAGRVPYGATIICIFQYDGRWKITNGGFTPITWDLGTAAALWRDSNICRYIFPRPLLEFTIHRAVNYFYFGNHYVPKEVMRSGIRIIASKDKDTKGRDGRFHYSVFSSEYIIIYNARPFDNAYTIGSTLHELGHMVMYKRNTIFGHGATDNILHESWACYVGWHVCEAYYLSLGWTRPAPTIDNDITGNNNQGWRTNLPKKDYNNSPLFIDLIDDFNQRNSVLDTNLPVDNISLEGSAVHRHILYVADHEMGISGCKKYLMKNLPCNKSNLELYLSNY